MEEHDAIPEYPFEYYLDFTYSHYGKPEFSPSGIKVPVRDLGVAKGFPGYDKYVYYKTCALVYTDVVSSVRSIFEYGPPEEKDGRLHYHIQSENQIVDGLFACDIHDTFHFTLEGISDEPHAWIHWEIIAKALTIELSCP